MLMVQIVTGPQMASRLWSLRQSVAERWRHWMHAGYDRQDHQ